jgi:lipoprotein-anchoring transpeptidase ErfK/SrfK
MSASPDFRQAIENALQSLRNGDRHTARRWAEYALTLNPNAEEPWLLLAGMANPRSSVGYVQRALKINPNSETARLALLWAKERLETAAPTQIPARSEPPKHSPRRGMLYPLLLVGLVCCLVLVIAAVSAVASPAVASILKRVSQPTATYPAQFAQANIAKPTFTSTPTQTLTPTITPSPTPTETPGVLEAAIIPDTPVPERAAVQAPDAAPSYTGNKYIIVDISEQHMYVYEGGALIYSFVASTGMNNSTRAGLFHVQSKIPNAYGATWNIWMPNWLGIYYSGGLENGIHALPILPSGARLWSGFLGRPISYGCVVLGEYESELLYNWAEIGTPVEIRR